MSLDYHDTEQNPFPLSLRLSREETSVRPNTEKHCKFTSIINLTYRIEKPLICIYASLFQRVWLHQYCTDWVCWVASHKVVHANLLQVFFDIRVTPDASIVCGTRPAVVDVVNYELVIGNDLKYVTFHQNSPWLQSLNTLQNTPY
jgi:hypothetical protein